MLHITKLLDYPDACPDEPLQILVTKPVFVTKLSESLQTVQGDS
jgi:hypothetical protein